MRTTTLIVAILGSFTVPAGCSANAPSPTDRAATVASSEFETAPTAQEAVPMEGTGELATVRNDGSTSPVGGASPVDPDRWPPIELPHNGRLTPVDPGVVARAFVEALLRRNRSEVLAVSDETFQAEAVASFVALADIPDSGQIVGTLVLSDVAGRADVAVSVAFPDRPDGSVFEPVAYRVELIATDDGWRVLAAGYL